VTAKLVEVVQEVFHLLQGTVEDPVKETITRYTDMGYSFGEVSLAITALQDETENQEKVGPLTKITLRKSSYAHSSCPGLYLTGLTSKCCADCFLHYEL
jgi:hypothetical protein